ncbi:methylated-DNA--[protein]-cysteine S-methyltransferase [Candidatus Neptunichlamydia sp. REUL1]|uniref:methylated-DNA--[protein]-cysteine S-methyltransferase n=1 Tax=Candidatus Neptunichlamydia sp. REUL1 TaxID=3064277 RepID=UPI00292E8B8E|nr:MGMT family protein [Candidatus Neptunochlamydia sp. REUL1]
MLLRETRSIDSGVQRRWALGPPIHAQFILQDSKVSRIRLALAEEFSCSIDGEGLKEEIFAWMDAYSKRKKGPPLPLILSSLTPFTRKGLKAIASIEIGDVASYGEIASRVGCAKGARAIGNVCNKNSYPLVIPCHRVIQGDGAIGGFAYDLRVKKTLLAYELTLCD